ncbi:MAG: DUF3343 domain-containing protein [Clostridia bacterium]|nr:DUF3343 domain-containing protein [Clostridia bacterium]
MYYIVFNSVTLATRVRNYFKYTGERVRLVHTPKSISKGGCSYSVIVEKHLVSKVAEVALEYGIKVLGVYKETNDGFDEVNSYDIS